MATKTQQRFRAHPDYKEVNGWLVRDHATREIVLTFPALGPYGTREQIGRHYAARAAEALNKAVASYAGSDERPEVHLVSLGIEDLGRPFKVSGQEE